MLKFIQIFLSTILALIILIVCCLFAIPILIAFWPLVIIALPIAILVYIIQYLEEKNKKKNKRKIGF